MDGQGGKLRLGSLGSLLGSLGSLESLGSLGSLGSRIAWRIASVVQATAHVLSAALSSLSLLRNRLVLDLDG